MIVRVRLFAVARQLAGKELVEVSLPSGGTIAQLRVALPEQFPALAPLGRAAMFSVGAEYADDNTRLAEGADVACIPPVSGG
ncbi:MAG TPA: MoaD/ThiS family protein [Pirellulales bacterium]|jgi:molybdopterin synthase catalytic subunit/molybdopterin synthase sulfur carrier subunit